MPLMRGNALANVRGRWRGHLGTLALLLAVWLGASAWQTRAVPAGAAPGFSASAVAAQAGAQLTLAQWRAAHAGRPVALNFWAEWCAICKLEQGNVSRVAADWPVLTVALRSGEAEQVRRELARRGLPWATVVDPQGTLAARYGVAAVPAFIVIDADGRVRGASVGYTTELGMRLRLWWAAKMPVL